MATVWSHRGDANWTKSTKTGWSNVIKFSSLTDLAASMEREELAGKVERLGIVAHGDQGGVVKLDRELTVKSLPNFKDEFSVLKKYLTPHALVIFYSCIMAAGEPGTSLLKAISQILPGRAIVGFTVYGIASYIPSHPGVMSFSRIPSGSRSEGMLNPWIDYAKWVLDGNIIRWPVSEQMFRQGNKCANLNCPGHTSPLHRCVGWGGVDIQRHHP